MDHYFSSCKGCPFVKENKDEEIVFALTACALFVQMTKILEDDRLPVGVEVKKFVNLQKKAKLPPMETKCPHCKEQIVIS